VALARASSNSGQTIKQFLPQPSEDYQRMSCPKSPIDHRHCSSFAVLMLLLIATVVCSVQIWSEMADTPMSSAGYVALTIGVVAATAVGAGLMGLVFYSGRQGFDDGVR
jgi:hypothetical protein